MKKLTRGQILVLVLTTTPMVAVGIGGAIGTYANAASVLHRKETALGVVAAGEGATLVAALVMIVITMLGQTAPTVIRAALWLLPTAASLMGLVIAPTTTEAVVFALTPLAMTASAEGVSLLARRIVVHRTGFDIEAQRRNASVLRRIAFHRARAERHPWKWVRAYSQLRSWRLMSRAGDGDAQLGSGLMTVQRDRLTEGADEALADMLTGRPAHRELLPAQPPVSREPDAEPAEPTDFETTVTTALDVTGSEPHARLTDPMQALARPLSAPPDLQISREPVLSPPEPLTVSPAEPTREPADEPQPDEIEQQITELAQRLRSGERLTKTTAAEVLGVSQATAGRRLRDARARIDEGTGFYP
ncbi:hypothetical protein OG481_02055 [Streptomyces longwoodensis]|uniref:hypothetical protein n=1 Tax=Streptomyces longwoodensis TaxID=68231 RepID=UPI002DD8E204|nr:hypothetical protein [Streptomyces longwoodensis]WRY87376.1 hypothetical protein OG481_02055 [Streptomyces longwoodensis]